MTLKFVHAVTMALLDYFAFGKHMRIGVLSASHWMHESRPSVRSTPVEQQMTPPGSVPTSTQTDRAKDHSHADKAKASVDATSTEDRELSPDQERELQQLKQRDREVRAHEQAHLSSGGQYASGMSFSYQTGPDGQQYAIGGEVQIDISEVANDPAATKMKMLQVQAAALAPADPSSTDRAVAAKARMRAARATQEIMEERALHAGGNTRSPQAQAQSNEANSDEVHRSETSQRPMSPTSTAGASARLNATAAYVSAVESPLARSMVHTFA